MAINPVPPTADGLNEDQVKPEADLLAEIADGFPIPIPIPRTEDPCQTSSLDCPSPESASKPVHSLPSLARLLQLEKYQSRRGRHVQARLYQAQVATARTSRLLSIARSTQQTLAECIRSEDKQSFVNLYGIFHDAVAQSVEPCDDFRLQSRSGEVEPTGYPESFIEALAPAQQSGLLDFLSSVRGDWSYVAHRLSLLTHKELLALLPQRNAARSTESVFESSTRSASRVSQNLGYVVDGQTDQIASLEPASPLEALVWCTRDLNKELRHDTIAQEIWASACGRLVSGQKRGMEKIVPAIIDTWGAASMWAGQDRLEAWIGRILQSGAFVLDQPSRQSFRVRIQGRPDLNAEDEGKVEAFFSRAVHSLLKLLADTNGASVIPDCAVALCRRIGAHISSLAQRDAFSSFVLTRWLFNSFIVDAITTPETHAMATERYISDNARHRILREVVTRTQKAVYHALHPWKHTSPAPTELVTTVHAIAARFQDFESFETPAQEEAFRGERQAGHELHFPETGSALLAVSMSDVAMMIDTLFPQRRPASLISDSDRSGLHSSASSVSGFSLFPTPNSSSTTLAYPFSSPQDVSKSISVPESEHAETEPAFMTDASSPSHIEAATLREVRASVEEFVVSGRFPLDQQLAVIRIDNAKATAVTQFMSLRSVVRGGFNEDPDCRPPKESASADFAYLKAVFQDALLTDELRDIPYIYQASPGALAGDWLLRSLDIRVRRAKDQGQFVLAHSNLSTLLRCETLIASYDTENLIASVLAQLEADVESKLAGALATIDACEAQLKTVQPALNIKQTTLQDSIHQCDLLRGKMLYTADVRTSAPYDEVRSIAGALKVMGKPKKPPKTRMAPPLRHWSGSKISSTNLHLKTEAQILELLSASASHGGPNKLSDDQSKSLASWLTSNSVENLCIGEERLQKLCMEIRKAVDNLTAAPTPILSSPLFVRDPASPMVGHSLGAGSAMGMSPLTSRFDMLRLHTNVSASRDGLSSTASSHPLSTRSSRDYLETRSPTLTSRSSGPFWSPSTSEAMSPSSVTSVGSVHPRGNFVKRGSKDAALLQSNDEILAQTRRQVTSLLLSEVTASMFNDGSETDQAFWTGLGAEIAEKHFCIVQSQEENFEEADLLSTYERFDFQEAFSALISRFAVCCDPAAKLSSLVEIDTLIGVRESTSPSSTSHWRRHHPQGSSHAEKRDPRVSLSDSKIKGFRRLFCNHQTRPAAVFRDLQYIATLVPSVTAGYSARSEAFSHASVAIIGLKKEVCNIMVETADSIIAYHSNNRGHGRSASTAQQQRDSATFPTTSQTPPAEDVAKYSMADAAHLLQITAKEGNAVAQRELATLYLTNPELMEHIIAPFARPKEVFKEELESKWRKNQDPARCDPVTMCVAHHWMSLSAKGGDALAKEYLKQREEMERLP